MVIDEDVMGEMCEVSPIVGLSWDDLDKIADVLTRGPLGSGHILNNHDVGAILGLLLRAGYTVLPVGPT